MQPGVRVTQPEILETSVDKTFGEISFLLTRVFLYNVICRSIY